MWPGWPASAAHARGCRRGGDPCWAWAWLGLLNPRAAVLKLLSLAVVGRELRVLWRWADVDALGRLVELAREPEELHQRRAGRGQRGPRGQRRLALDVDDEPVEVRALLDTGGLDPVGDLEHR